MSAMATHLASLFSALLLCLLLTISVDAAGRWKISQKKNGETFTTFSASSITSVGAVSRATSTTTTTTYSGKTNFADVTGLGRLCLRYPLLQESNLDPCLPPVWSWIECNSDPRPRVIALNLGSRLLYGILPDFSMMDALQSIDLQHNSLYGTIPSFLGDFPSLQTLNLAYNLFTGQVPDSIACNTNLKLSLYGNYGLYTSNSCPSGINTAVPTPTTTTIPQPNYPGSGYNEYIPTTYRRRKIRTPLILGSSVSASGVVGIGGGIFAIRRHRARVAAANAQGN